MLKVLSTKLKLEDVERFAEMAEQQGESRSELLRRLVLDYLDGSSKADRVASTGTSNPTSSSKKGLLLHGEGLPIHEDVDRPLNPPLLPIGRQPVYHNAEPGRPATSPKQSSGIGWLILGGLLVGGLLLEPTTAVDRAAVPVRRKPLLGVYH